MFLAQLMRTTMPCLKPHTGHLAHGLIARRSRQKHVRVAAESRAHAVSFVFVTALPLMNQIFAYTL